MATCDTCKANKVCDHNKYGFENCGNYIPADVVPRAEVDKTITEWAYLHADAVNKLDNVRAEVAREVIEEIFLRIREEFSISELGKSALNQLEAELKKKYTGEERNNR